MNLYIYETHGEPVYAGESETSMIAGYDNIQRGFMLLKEDDEGPDDPAEYRNFRRAISHLDRAELEDLRNQIDRALSA